MKKALLFALAALLLNVNLCNAQEVNFKERYNNNGKWLGWGLWNSKTERWVSEKTYPYGNPYLVHNYNGTWYYLAKGNNNLWGIICSKNYNSWWINNEYTSLDEHMPSFSEHGCAHFKKGQNWGYVDVVNQRVLLPFKYRGVIDTYDNDQIGFVTWEGEQVYFSVRKLKAEASAKAEAEAKAKREAEIREAEARRQAEYRRIKEEKLASFTKYATAYVQPKMAEWQKKGEFEKVADYTRRVSGENRQRKIDALTKEAEDRFIKENRENINLKTSLTLDAYDSENEVFSLNSSKFGRLLVPVPISEGPTFKKEFKNATFSNEKYFIENDKIALASFDIKIESYDIMKGTSNNTYHYSNNNALNYSQYQLNPDALDLPAINIVTGSSTSSMRKPKVQILSPQNGSQYQQGTVSFRINVVPGDGNQPVLYVEINGAEAVALQPVTQGAKGARAVEGKLYEVSLPTEPGKTVNLAFTARDEQNVTSETQKVKLTYVGQVRKPQLILFAVGVGDYTSGDLTKLRYAAKDARDFSATIRQCNLSDYTGLKEHLYTDRQATRSNINKGLREVLSEAQGGDVVMFYFSGHGVQDGSETYFMTIDASSEAPSDEGVNFADLKNNMRKLTERQVKVVAFMDACHAGAMVGAKGAAPKLTELDVQNVIEFYSSTTGEESAEDEKLQNGVFTAGLISGLNGAAANADGYITVNTLRTYLSDYVRNKNSRQTPVFKGVDAGDITLFHKK